MFTFLCFYKTILCLYFVIHWQSLTKYISVERELSQFLRKEISYEDNDSKKKSVTKPIPDGFEFKTNGSALTLTRESANEM